jgi:hypothetical protein
MLRGVRFESRPDFLLRAEPIVEIVTRIGVPLDVKLIGARTDAIFQVDRRAGCCVRPMGAMSFGHDASPVSEHRSERRWLRCLASHGEVSVGWSLLTERRLESALR